MAMNAAVKTAVIAAAQANGMNPAALLAVVEIESGGQLLESDKITPRFLFERHVFYRELKKLQPKKLDAAISAGLAIPKWSRATQYDDQGKSKDRLALIARARKIDEECANRSASWGLGQTMGFNAEGLKFKSATAMVAYLETSGIPAHVDCMVREIKRRRLQTKLQALDWAGFARVYNGAGYAQNKYDTRLAEAFGRWQAALGDGDAPSPPPSVPDSVVPVAVEEPTEPLLPTDVVGEDGGDGVQGDRDLWHVQRRLKAMGYAPGELDGLWGSRTSGAIAGFIADRRLTMVVPTTAQSFVGIVKALRAELGKAEAEVFTRPIAIERALATPTELAPKLPEVKAAIQAERLGFWGSMAGFVSATVTGIGSFLGDAVEWLNKVKEVAGDLPWWVWIAGLFTISAGLYYVSWKSGEAKNAATDAFRAGERT